MLRRKRTRRRAQKLILRHNRLRIVIYTFLIFFVLGWIMQADHVQIKNIEINELSNTSEEVIRAIINQEIIGNYVLVIPRKNIFLIPKNTIKKRILLDHRIKDVSISRKSFDTLSVLVDERTHDSVWCSKEREAVSVYEDSTIPKILSESCFLLDDGLVFDIVPESFQIADVPEFIIETSPNGINVGARILGEVRSNEINNFISYLKTEEIKTSKVYIGDNGDSTITTNRDVDILFSNSIPIKDTMDNFYTVVHSLELAPVNLEPGNGFDKLLYIDFRFGKKIFYKLK